MIKRKFFRGFAGCAIIALCVTCMSVGAKAVDQSDFSDAAAQLEKAEKEFEQTAKSSSDAQGAGSGTSQQTGKMSWSSASSAPAASVGQPEDPRASALQGSPETGYAGTWTDPATGDVITSVIAPTPPQTRQPDYPIIVEPNVSSSGWSGSPGWGPNSYGAPNWNQGWNGHQYNGPWPQWPGYPGNNGYPPQEMPNASNGFRPVPPPPSRPHYDHGFYPPNPFEPGYRPLRPIPGGQPGWGGTPPPKPQWPGGIWGNQRPPQGPPPRPQGPGNIWGNQRPPQGPPPQGGNFPMRPGGSSWNPGGFPGPGGPIVQPRGGY